MCPICQVVNVLMCQGVNVSMCPSQILDLARKPINSPPAVICTSFFSSAPPEQTARSDSFIIASFYRPPSAITSLSDLLLNPTSLFPPLSQTCCQNATYPLDRVPNCHECQKWVGEPDYLPTRQGPQPTPRDSDYLPTRDRVPA